MKEKFILEEELLEKIEEITDVDYGNDLEISDITAMLKDLVLAYHDLEYKLKEKEEYCEEYHKNKITDLYDYYGVSREDF